MVLALRLRLLLILGGATSTELTDETVELRPLLGGRTGEFISIDTVFEESCVRMTGRLIAGNDSEDFKAGSGSGGVNKLRDGFVSSAEERVEVLGLVFDGWGVIFGDTGAEWTLDEEDPVFGVFSVMEME